METAGRMIAPTGSGSDEIDRLKVLLFRPEAQKLSSLAAAIDTLEQRVGTPDRLEIATAEVLVDAFRRVEIAHHRDLADAVAPVVVAAIRNEIKNSKDMMVEALYPITGRLVSAGIAVAMAELAASINARMDSLLSVDMLKLRFAAWRSGKPVSELAFAQAQRGRLVRLLFLARGSGQLLGQWQADHGEDARADLVSGMIAALTDFARNALGESGGELRNLDLGGHNIYLRSSARTIIAAEFAGELGAGQQRALDTAFLALLDANATDSANPEKALDALAVSVEQAKAGQAKPVARLSPLHILGLLLLAGLAFWGYVMWQRWRIESRVVQAVAQTIQLRPELLAYPLKTTLHNKAGTVRLTGLVPAQGDQEALNAAVGAAAAPYKLQSALAIITTRPRLEEVRSANASLDQKLAGLNAETRELQVRLASDTTATRTELAERIQAEAASLSARLNQYYTDLNTTRAKLSGEAGAGALALHAEIEAGLAGLAADSAAIKAETETRMRAELASLGLELAAIRAELAQTQRAADTQAKAALALVENLGAGLRGEISTTRTDIAAGYSAQVTQLFNRLVEVQGELVASLAAARAETAALRSRLDQPQARLDEELRGFAVFFQNTGEAIEDEENVRAKLAHIAKAAMAAGGIRVIGHADSTGTAAANLKISRQRAELVGTMLAGLGLDSQRIVIAPRGDSEPLAGEGAATAQRNRRVTFEALFTHEIRP